MWRWFSRCLWPPADRNDLAMQVEDEPLTSIQLFRFRTVNGRVGHVYAKSTEEAQDYADTAYGDVQHIWRVEA
jgi:hypothetical protein